MTLTNLTTDDLARHCAEETGRYALRQTNDPRYCFELMRRAFADGHSDALTAVYRIYQDQVTRWVYRHQSFEQTGESAEYFASGALSNTFFALRGPEKFSRFRTVSQVLAYLKVCVHTAIMVYRRDQAYAQVTAIDEVNDPSETPDLTTDISAQELWADICALLPDLEDQRLARLHFVQRLRPAQIVVEHGDIWETERAVSVALQRLRRTLRNSPRIRAWAGLPPYP